MMAAMASHDRLLLRRHGPALVGSARTSAKVATSYAKQTVFAGLHALGGESLILRRKVAPSSPAALAEARAALRTARSAATACRAIPHGTALAAHMGVRGGGSRSIAVIPMIHYEVIP